MLPVIRRSIRNQLMLATMATTIVALLVTAVILVVYDYRTYRSAWVSDLDTQAGILGRASAPALEFDDPATAKQYLTYLNARPRILAAAIYTSGGKLFANYIRPGVTGITWPARPDRVGWRVESGRLIFIKRIAGADGDIGTVYLLAKYQLTERLWRYMSIVGAVLALSLLVGALLSYRMQRTLADPILAISEVAHQVRDRRAFSLRVEKTPTEGEIGYLVDAFNDMLAEIERRSRSLEQANVTLEKEIAIRQSAELALRAADQRKDEFLATLAHELRNPLAPLRNSLGILRASGPHDEATTNALDVMDRQLRQLVRLVDDLLDVARITTGKVVLRREPVVLGPIIQSAIDTTSSFMRARGHQVEVDLPPRPVHLSADATRLEQVFVNLLHNAAKFTEAGGRIALRGERLDGEFVVTVSDSGIGIPSDMLPVVFEMFAQVDRSLERPHAGLGVGLSLARRFVELHGGSLEGFSEGTGRGSQFVVRLPVLPESELPAIATDGVARHPSRKGAQRILVADDNQDCADTIAVILRMTGHDVRVAYDGGEALEAAGAFLPDIAVLDIGLPRMNGYDLARSLREGEGGRRLLLVAMTGWGQDEDRRRARAAGFDHHLVKPVDPDRLLEILAAWQQD